jgi:hypothetical protein
MESEEIMDEEHTETCECTEHKEQEITVSEPAKLSPEQEKREANRKLRNSRKGAKRKLLKMAKSKREKKFIKKILGIRMTA